jgi:hypothetical protein
MGNSTEYINNTNLTTWTINDNEIGKYTISPKGSSGGTLPLYIPKLMPLISMGKRKTTTTGINSSCYCNASECKPNIGSTTVSIQNFINVPPQSNRSFSLPIFYYGDTIQVEVHNGNVDELYLSTRVDNSHVE